MSDAVYIVAAKRTAVAPRDGAFATIDVAELGAAVMRAVLRDAEVSPNDVDGVYMGNALYGGGNPARVAALASGLPETVPALTVDTQCCGGIDAVALAAARIRAGDADIVIAGGLESYSRSPLRLHRPVYKGGAPKPYDRPPFTPWADRDPDMLDAAAILAARRKIPRPAQETYAIESHRRAREDRSVADEIEPVRDMTTDAFTRNLTAAACARLPVVAGDNETGLTASTIAVEADAAAALLLMSEATAERAGLLGRCVRMVGGVAVGADPEMPATAPVSAVRTLLRRHSVRSEDIALIELMEAFAVQAMDNMAALGLDPQRVNVRGGALARGHPIGASGAILLVRLYHDLMRMAPGGLGLAAIAGAGGLGSAALLCRDAGR